MTNRQAVTCLRCNYTWTPYKEEPVECQKCSSYYWNKPIPTIVKCPVVGCSFKATGETAKLKVSSHLTRTIGNGHGSLNRSPSRVRKKLAAI